MLEIKQTRRRWPRVLMTLLIVMLLGVGGYLLLTVFSPALPVLSGKAPHETERKLAEPVGTFGDRLFIPKINIDVPIITGKDSNALEKGAWHRKPENGDPARGGNFVLSAHRFVMSFTPQGTAIKSPFYNIGQLEVGDRITVDYQSKRYYYEIKEKYSVKPSGVEVEAPTRDPQLTLYSCTLQGSSDGRDVLVAKPVK